jgi:hypothetical protein
VKFVAGFAYPFRRGEFFSPVVKGVPTQAATKARWPDGSVKHVVFYALYDGMPGESRVAEFVEGTPVAGPQVVAPPDVSMEVTKILNGVETVFRWSAADFATTAETWIDGPIATVKIYRNRRHADQFMPEFHVTFYHGLNLIDVRFVGSNDNCLKVA